GAWGRAGLGRPPRREAPHSVSACSLFPVWPLPEPLGVCERTGADCPAAPTGTGDAAAGTTRREQCALRCGPRDCSVDSAALLLSRGAFRSPLCERPRIFARLGRSLRCATALPHLGCW
ncbi:hypothetical protein H1C71_018833, partial [Ictidomys tridecemlineatus]